MRVFLEKGFVENFEIEFSDKKHSDAFRRLYRLFTEYPNIVAFIDVTEEELKETIIDSEILSKLTDINPRIYACKDLKNTILREKSWQTLVFTEKQQNWFSEIDDETILMFCYENLESSLQCFLDRNHRKHDLSDDETKFEWNYFDFISEKNNILIISDPYVLVDFRKQKIKDNLLKLLKENINKEKFYDVFIITDFIDYKINKKYQLLNRELAGYNVKIYLINRIKDIENIDLHDRLLYTNYTITASPSGFNIKRDKPVNSELVTSSIFDAYTYKKYSNHMRSLNKYLQLLRRHSDYMDNLRVLPEKTFNEFQNVLAELCT